LAAVGLLDPFIEGFSFKVQQGVQDHEQAFRYLFTALLVYVTKHITTF